MSKSGRISSEFTSSVRQTLSRNKLVRRRLPGWGRIHIDRQQPFLCLYRSPSKVEDIGTKELLLGQASYLIAPGQKSTIPSLRVLVKGVVAELVKSFGGVVLLEIWSSNPDPVDKLANPTFRVFAPAHDFPQATLETLETGLLGANWPFGKPEILLNYERQPSAPTLQPILTHNDAEKLNCSMLGLEVPPAFREAPNGPVYPEILRAIRRELNHVLKQVFYSFAHSEATYRPAHYHELGPRAITRSVWEADRQLGSIGDSFDMLLALTPTNSESAWNAFRRYHFDKPPEFHYRPQTVDPSALKQRLYKIPLDRIEDPALHAYFEGKRDELDRQISMLRDRGTRDVLFSSMQVYGYPDHRLIDRAKTILAALPPHVHDDTVSDYVDAHTFACHAETEIERLRQTAPDLSATVQVRDDVPGVMVSKGHLLIGREARIAKSRIDATVQHEVGTHIVTHYNGTTQPFQQLHTGSAGYEECQEGLAVLAEYLVGGLSRPRLRLLAGRVLAVDHLVRGADFIETYRGLHEDHGFGQKTAYYIAMRVFRGGGLTKDMVYLRGFSRLIDQLASGVELPVFLIGKIAFDDLEIVEELVWRNILAPAPLQSSYLDRSEVKAKLAQIANHDAGHGLEIVIGDIR